MRHKKYWPLIAIFIFLLSIIGCQKGRINQTNTTNLAAESTKATTNVIGVYKKKTEKQGKDFYEIIISVVSLDDGMGGHKTKLKVTSRVRRHVSFWFDHNKVAYHTLGISYTLGNGAQDLISNSKKVKELVVNKDLYGQWIRSIRVVGHAVKQEKVIKIFDLDFKLGEN